MSKPQRYMDSPRQSLLAKARRCPQEATLALLTLYRTLTENRPHCCRFYPSCSVYAMMAIRQQGLIRGLAKAGWRVLRCYPFRPLKVEYPGFEKSALKVKQ